MSSTKEYCNFTLAGWLYTSNKDSTSVLKRPPEERNVENNSDICDIVSSIVLDFLVHHKNKNFGAYT